MGLTNREEGGGMSEDLIEVLYGVIIVCIYQTDVVFSKIQELRTRVEQTVRLGLYAIHVNYRCDGDARCWTRNCRASYSMHVQVEREMQIRVSKALCSGSLRPAPKETARVVARCAGVSSAETKVSCPAALTSISLYNTLS